MRSAKLYNTCYFFNNKKQISSFHSTARTTQHFLKFGGTMAKLCYGKWGYWIPPVGVLLTLFAVISAEPPGFLSISCGGEDGYIDENNITWVTDAGYIDVGEVEYIGDIRYTYGSYMQYLREFRSPLDKSCYRLPVNSAGVPFLLRLWFIPGNYTRFKQSRSFNYSIETVDMLAVDSIQVLEGGLYSESILYTSDTVMYVCLIRTSESEDPFISGIELRPFRNGMYPQARPGTMLLPILRNDAGGNRTFLRYPLDNFDRIWTQNIASTDVTLYWPVRSDLNFSTSNTVYLPPPAVMQTAWVADSVDPNGIKFPLGSGSRQASKSLLLLYFAEVETLPTSEPRSFYVQINGKTQSETITLVQNYFPIELPFVSNEPRESDNFTLWKASNSIYGPIINAYEYFLLIDSQPATYSQDIKALHAIKRNFDLRDWISDPCYAIPWKGIGCDNSPSGIRISEIDLSGRNLRGSLPKDIEQLTGLVNVSLQNNNLIGAFPNFSHLTMLERLYLQNNNLNGIVPGWLSELKNLKELNIENNNFSGVIPPQLLHNCSLKLNYSGNYLLAMNKRECTLQNSNKNNNKLKLVLGITLSGILIISSALMVGTVLYRKKIRRNREGVATKRSPVEKELKPFLYQDYSVISVPNPTKSRAFTLEEMVAATQTFSREIGRGGFGSVFFGQLPEGKDIAVKVLSLFSRQGVQEFLNEVDLLSRINHRNLVSLLGYCNETREVMLIYEHMSGGSLRDHLHGNRPEHSELNWKTRLKITLDAAQGLEYLHVGSTQKIIHRDIKTANILLDNNMNGKLADFGLSRMTLDGEATHVTTAVKGTAGYLDPEYYSTQMLTEKSDVYSFGVVLLEIVCGRPAIDLQLPVHELNIVRWVTPYLNENDDKITEIIDKRLDGIYNMESMTRVINIAMRCVQFEPSSRPSVSDVVAELKEAIKHEDTASTSISDEIGMDLLAIPVDSSFDFSEPKGMEWSDSWLHHFKKLEGKFVICGVN